MALGVPLLALNVCPESDGDAKQMLRQVLDPCREQHPQLTVVTRIVRDASPKYVLHDLSQHAALTVVGSRGHGGYLAVLLGSSVSFWCATVLGPVAIVRTAGSRPYGQERLAGGAVGIDME